MAKVSFPSIEDVRSEPPSHDGVSNLGHPPLLSWRGCWTSWSSTPFPKGAVEVVESEVGHHDMDVQRDVLETEVWEFIITWLYSTLLEKLFFCLETKHLKASWISELTVFILVCQQHSNI